MSRFVWMAVVTWMLAVVAQAMYMRPDLDKIPIGRLIENMEAQLKEKPDDAQLALNLARAHGMAFSQKLTDGDTVQVRRGKESNGVWFGFEPSHVPFDKVKDSDDAERQAAAEKHLRRAIELFDQSIKRMEDQTSRNRLFMTAKIGRAWCLEQSLDMDQPDERQKAIAAYREFMELAWERESKRGAGLGEFMYVEAAGYLKALLDAEKDADEIAEIEANIKHLRSLPRAITPIAIPLEDGLTLNDLVDREARVAFDLDGTGLTPEWEWLTPRAGWLVYDRGDSNQVDSAIQMFGNASFMLRLDNGYAALALLDDNADGELRGEELRSIKIWRDANSNGTTEAGEVAPLSEWGIVALSCAYQTHTSGIAHNPAGVTFDSGATRASYDIILNQRNAPTRSSAR